MNLKNILKIIGLLLIFVLLQSYFSSTESFMKILNKWTNYFSVIMGAIFIAILLNPMVEFLKKKLKINDVLAISLSILILLLLIVLLFIIVVPQIISSVRELNNIYPYVSEKITKFIQILEEKNIYKIDTQEANQNISDYIKNNSENIKRFISSIVGSLIRWTIGITNLFIAFTLAFFILLEKKKLLKTLENIVKILFSKKNTSYVMKKLKDSQTIFLNYIVARIIISFIVAICMYIILLISGTPYAALSAVLAGVGNMIPYIGPLISGIISFFLILIIAPIKTLFLIVAIVFAQLMDNFLIGPKIMGNKVGLSDFWVMVSMIIFGNLFGLMGVFLGVPLMSIIKLFYKDLLEKAEQGGNE